MFYDIVLFDGEQFELGYDKVYKATLLHLNEPKKAEGLAVFECNEFDLKQVLESKKASIVILSEKAEKDSLHWRRTALNRSLCELAKKKDIAVAFSFSTILNAKNRPLLFGRIMQNIRLCRKYKVDMLFASFAKNKWEMRAPHELIAFAQLLGMTPGEAKRSLELAGEIAKRKEEKWVAKGVWIVNEHNKGHS